MNLLIKLFVLLYLMALVMITILSVVWILSAVLTHELPSMKNLVARFQNMKRV